MPTAQKVRSTANLFWSLTIDLLIALVGVWIVAGVKAGVGELDERCAHGIVGPGGRHEVERTAYPPNVTCVYPSGETISSAGVLVFVWWTCVVLVVVCALTAFALEFVGLSRRGFDSRFPALAVVFPSLLANLYVLVLLATVVPTLVNPTRCGLGTRSSGDEANLRYEPFPQQVTCDYGHGFPMALVPQWVAALEWALLLATAISLAGVLAQRRARVSARGPGM
ncbi:hypothetical protein [Nocardiopsis lucentensis]|uniref:hypothetical protein n=1 Tax=Nocardiopsis lucentensis TaxID=53441 RepID=UPI000345C37F|nr:hypothetical protein [Nocardiopsis lucentensis]